MFQVYVPNVSVVSYACCIVLSMLQVFHEQAMETNADGGGPMAAGGPHVRTYTNCLILLCNSVMACDGQICPLIISGSSGLRSDYFLLLIVSFCYVNNSVIARAR
jgi:hypothetical protein